MRLPPLHGVRILVVALTTTIITAIGGSQIVAAETPVSDVPANERPFAEDVLLLLPTAAAPEIAGGLLEQEILRQAVLLAGREELNLRTRDASLRELDPWGGHADLGAVAISVRGGGPQPLVLELKRPARTGDKVWTVTAGPGNATSLAAEAEILSRGRLVEALRALEFRGPDERPAPRSLTGRDAVDAALFDEPTSDPAADLTDRFDLVSQFATLRTWHGAIEAQGETPERLAGLVRGYANLGFLTADHWSPASRSYQARSLLYAARLLHQDPQSPEAWQVRAYALCLLGSPAASLADLEHAAALSGEKHQAPGWVVAAEAHARGDRVSLARLADDGARPARLLARLLVLREAELGGDEQAILRASQALRDEEPACPLWLRARLGGQMPLGIKREAQQEALSAAMTWLYEPLERCGLRLPAAVPEFDADDPIAEGKIRETYVADPFGYNRQRFDVGEPSLVAFGRMIQDEGFVQGRRIVSVLAFSLAVEADELVALVRPWCRHHPYRRMLDAYEQDRGSDDFPAVLAAIQDEPALPQALFFYDWAAPLADAVHRQEAAHRNADETVPDLVWRIDEADESPAERQRLARVLEEIAPESTVTVTRLVRHDAERVADRLAEWETHFHEESTVMHAIADRHIALMQFADAVRCLRTILELAPSHDSYAKLADAERAAGRDEKFIAALEASMELPSVGLEDARAAERIARYHMRHARWDEALPYAERAAASYSDWGLACEAEVREALGDDKAAEALQQARSERYDSSRHEWYFWCLRTGRGDVWSAKRLAEPSLEFWRKWERHPKSEIENLRRLAFLDQMEDREADALDRYTRLWERARQAYDALMVALIADSLGQTNIRDTHLRHAVRKGDEHDPSVGALARAMLDTLGVPLKEPSEETKANAPPETVPAGPSLDFERGLDLIRRTAHTPGAATNACYFLARFLDNRGRSDEASRAYALSASSPLTNKFAVSVSAAMLRRRQAEIPPRRGVELDGPTTRVVELYEQATQYSRRAEYLPALLRLDEARQARPGHLEVLEAQGEMLLMLERFRESAAAFETLLAAAPYRLDVRFRRGRVLEYAGDHAAAIAEYERLLAAEPDVELRNDTRFVLAWLYASCADASFRDASEALRHVGEVQITEQTPAWEVERTRAAALAAAGRFGEAVRLAKATLPQVPASDRLLLREQLDHYRAGQPHVRHGKWWRRALGLSPIDAAQTASSSESLAVRPRLPVEAARPDRNERP